MRIMIKVEFNAKTVLSLNFISISGFKKILTHPSLLNDANTILGLE